MKRHLIALCLLVAACGESDDGTRPGPQALADDAIGYFCGMYVVEHEGPKAQVFVKGEAEPYWFVSARDAIAFQHLEETPQAVTAFYVTDMTASDWAKPGAWIDGASAWYVLGGSRLGGMGASETVPFASREAARAFAADFGGQVAAYDAIPAEAVLASR
jgi:copper chaperone NosL